MAIYFTSDTHFGHKSIITFSNRPYKCIEEMDEDIIQHWNARVGAKDTIYHLGDFTWYRNESQQRRIIDRLNGNIKLLLGNHDGDLKYWPSKITLCDPITKLKFDHCTLELCHYPLLEWDDAFRGAIQLHGHSHNLWPQTTYRRLDIGVDGNNMNPWELEEIRSWAKDRPVFSPEVFQTTAP
jgi:calcineurin-like phosphoesterase family protein